MSAIDETIKRDRCLDASHVIEAFEKDGGTVARDTCHCGAALLSCFVCEQKTLCPTHDCSYCGPNFVREVIAEHNEKRRWRR